MNQVPGSWLQKPSVDMALNGIPERVAGRIRRAFNALKIMSASGRRLSRIGKYGSEWWCAMEGLGKLGPETMVFALLARVSNQKAKP